MTQDFGHSLPSRSDAEAEVLVARSVDRARPRVTCPGYSAWTAGKRRPRHAPWRRLIHCALRGRKLAQFCATQLLSRRYFPKTHPSLSRPGQSLFRRRFLLCPYTRVSRRGVLGGAALLLDGFFTPRWSQKWEGFEKRRARSGKGTSLVVPPSHRNLLRFSA